MGWSPPEGTTSPGRVRSKASGKTGAESRIASCLAVIAVSHSAFSSLIALPSDLRSELGAEANSLKSRGISPLGPMSSERTSCSDCREATVANLSRPEARISSKSRITSRQPFLRKPPPNIRSDDARSSGACLPYTSGRRPIARWRGPLLLVARRGTSPARIEP